MIALTGFFAVALIAMLLAKETPFGRLCHRELVERPAATLAKFRSHHLIYALILVPILLSGAEFVALLGPEFFAAYALELAVYFDAVIFVAVTSAVAHVKGAVRLVAPAFRRARPRRKRSAVSRRPGRETANDDDPPDARIAA